MIDYVSHVNDDQGTPTDESGGKRNLESDEAQEELDLVSVNYHY